MEYPTAVPSNRLYITNLSYSTPVEALTDFIREQTGSVEYVEYPPRQRGCAIVEFASVDQAANAIDILNGQVLDDREMGARFDRPKAAKAPKQQFQQQQQQYQQQNTVATASNRLYITNLSYSTTADALTDFIRQQIGSVESVDFPPRQRGCAIVEFASVDQASNAIDILNGQILDDRDIGARFDRPKAPKQQFQQQQQQPQQQQNNRVSTSTTVRHTRPPTDQHAAHTPGSAVYISGLPWSVTWTDLKDMGREFGEVSFADVYTDRSGRSRGFGLMRFESPEAAHAAINGLNGTELRSRTIMARVYEERTAADANTQAPVYEQSY